MKDLSGFRVISALILACSLVLAPAASATQAEAALPSHPAATKADLATFFDGLMPAQLARDDIAGAYVAVVAKGEVVFAKGYGYADVAAGKVVTNDTLFRVGSVSKLMTWTAVMQLVEQGKIDLDADINKYLDFAIPAAFGKPITMRHLMTHTAGFEDGIQGLWTTPSQVEQLRPYVVNHMKQRIFAPGTVAAYSNYGATLAGYIVERVSGETFNAYVARHITGPLAMQHTSLAQPLGAELAPLMSQAYHRASQGAAPFEVVLAPAGGVSTSGPDMARFMLAFLQGGSLDERSILKLETVALMHSRQWASDPRENATGLGWLGASYNGHSLIGHGGDTLFFHTNMDLIPQAQTGLFVVYNSNGKNGRAGGFVLRSFMDRYFPPASPNANAAGPKGNGAELAGMYISSRRGQSTMGYMFAMMDQTRVSVNANGNISTTKAMTPGAPAKRWNETAPGFWSGQDGQQRHMIFQQATNGNWQFTNGSPATVYQRSAWYQNAYLVTGLLAFAVLVCTVSILAMPVLAWRRRSRPATLAAAGQGSVHGAAALCLLMWAVAGVLMLLAMTNPIYIASPDYGVGMRAVQVASWLHAFGSAVLLWRSRHVWSAAGKSTWTRSHQALVALACIASVWLCWQGNMLAMGLRY